MDDKTYWTQRYEAGTTGWNIGYPSTPIKEYADQLTDKNLKILIPGAGNGYEAEYLFEIGFKNVHVLDVAEIPLTEFKKRNPHFPEAQVIHADFFAHEGSYDLILEQTFFCSIVPTDANRSAYFKQMRRLLKPDGILAGLWFDFPLTDDMEKRPYGGNKELYLGYLDPYFTVRTFARCYNSIPPRKGNELFGIFERK
ncbi:MULTISPECIES: methyltransferase domain-containing protein [Maribacter]|uniref:Methyltransferase domain-containing protein n=1 Tax=Maribacter flavus TaxID=1658664 RepID=A0ABU7IKA2_9FLAO|nr:MULTISPECIES: methyltransferase domain-containing protein [Maribacter]MDC6406102.1 methyltransferase domain-containing protein [Maribacter sp. PR66]MEE1973113.1 methyltransferase domain-containing protein [Maribacter flavus]